MVLENGFNWAQNHPSILMSVRGIVNKSTGYSPYELMTGRKMRLPEHLLFEVPKPMIEEWMTENYLKNLCSSLPAIYYQVAHKFDSVKNTTRCIMIRMCMIINLSLVMRSW